MLEGKRLVQANRVIEMPIERLEVGIKEQKKGKLLTLGECLTGFPAL